MEWRCMKSTNNHLLEYFKKREVHCNFKENTMSNIAIL